MNFLKGKNQNSVILGTAGSGRTINEILENRKGELFLTTLVGVRKIVDSKEKKS